MFAAAKSLFSSTKAGPVTSRVFTVPPGRPFLDSLARAILAGDLPSAGGRKPDPIELPSYTLLLPTRRATRAVQEAFLRVSGGKAMLLPRILPIAEGQEDLTLLDACRVPMHSLRVISTSRRPSARWSGG